MSSFGQSISWLLPFGLLVFVIVVVPLRILDEQGLPRYRALRQELQEVRRTNQSIKREVRELQRIVRALRSDQAAIEKTARDEFGMLHKGELLFQF